jgi:hypothetical protein
MDKPAGSSGTCYHLSRYIGETLPVMMLCMTAVLHMAVAMTLCAAMRSRSAMMVVNAMSFVVARHCGRRNGPCKREGDRGGGQLLAGDDFCLHGLPPLPFADCDDVDEPTGVLLR